MANTSAEQRAARAIKTFEASGKIVESVSINGKAMTFKFKQEPEDELGFIDFKARK